MLVIRGPLTYQLVPHATWREPTLQPRFDLIFGDNIIPHGCCNENAVVGIKPQYLLEELRAVQLGPAGPGERDGVQEDETVKLYVSLPPYPGGNVLEDTH